MAPYWAEHASLSSTPEARRPQHTRVEELGPGRYRVQQRLIDPEGDEDWALDCLVDLNDTSSAGEAAAILDLQRIGI